MRVTWTRLGPADVGNPAGGRYRHTVLPGPGPCRISGRAHLPPGAPWYVRGLHRHSAGQPPLPATAVRATTSTSPRWRLHRRRSGARNSRQLSSGVPSRQTARPARSVSTTSWRNGTHFPAALNRQRRSFRDSRRETAKTRHKLDIHPRPAVHRPPFERYRQNRENLCVCWTPS